MKEVHRLTNAEAMALYDAIKAEYKKDMTKAFDVTVMQKLLAKTIRHLTEANVRGALDRMSAAGILLASKGGRRGVPIKYASADFEKVVPGYGMTGRHYTPGRKSPRKNIDKSIKPQLKWVQMNPQAAKTSGFKPTQFLVISTDNAPLLKQIIELFPKGELAAVADGIHIEVSGQTLFIEYGVAKLVTAVVH